MSWVFWVFFIAIVVRVLFANATKSAARDRGKRARGSARRTTGGAAAAATGPAGPWAPPGKAGPWVQPGPPPSALPYPEQQYPQSYPGSAEIRSAADAAVAAYAPGELPPDVRRELEQLEHELDGAASTARADPAPVPPPPRPQSQRYVGSAALESTLDSTIESSLFGARDTSVTSALLPGSRSVTLPDALESQVRALMLDGHEVAAVRLVCDELDLGILDAVRATREVIGLPSV